MEDIVTNFRNATGNYSWERKEQYMTEHIKKQIKESCNLMTQLLSDSALVNTIDAISLRIIDVYKNGRKVLLAGNGGSAGDAQHIAGELVNKFYFDRPGLPAMALTTDTSILTAISNDFGFDKIFARQIQANGMPGDLFIGISTSGSSPNILAAIEECRKIGITTVGFTGRSGSKMAELCDYCIMIPSGETPRIQEAHILIGHIICSVVEKALFGSEA